MSEAEPLFVDFDPAREPSEGKIRVLAHVLAGFRWPARGSFESLTKRQRDAATDAAREALRRLAREAD